MAKSFPVIYVRGSYYEVGFNVGRTFKGMIHEFIAESAYLNDVLIPAYNTKGGYAIYEEVLEIVKQKFPHYIRELTGISDGAQVPFYKLMLLHMDSIIPENIATDSSNKPSGSGCTTIICNQTDVAIGHTEDAYGVAFNRCYVVHCHIIDHDHPKGVHEERFSSLCYAGHLPGFCMNVNHHGFVYTINIIQPTRIYSGKTRESSPQHCRPSIERIQYEQVVPFKSVLGRITFGEI